MSIAVLIDRNPPPIIRETQHPTALEANALLAEAGVQKTAAYGEEGASDLEDWAEAVCRYAAATRFARAHGLKTTTDVDQTGTLLDLRAFATRVELHQPKDNVIGAARSTPYALTQAFATHAQRPFLICRNDSDTDLPYPTLSDGMKTAQGWRVSRSYPAEELVWKQVTGPDKAYPVVYIANNGEMPSDLGFQAYGAGGLSMLQARVPMGYEARFFVVDGTVVSGAGAIEHFTPFDRQRQSIHGVTHPVFEGKRNSPDYPLILPSMADVLDKAAARITPDFIRDLGVKDFALDLFMNTATAQIGVVEVNPVNASGFYANDGVAVYTRLAETLLARAGAAVAA